jgi:ribosome biogenesis GTPase
MRSIKKSKPWEENLKKGFIKKQISNQYTIIDLDTHEEMIAKARGKLRYQKLDEDSSFNKQTSKKTKIEQKIIQVSPKVGDHVFYEFKDDHVMITDILPRKNDLTRPDVANVDQAILVFSAVNPDFSFHLLDRFLIIMSLENLTPIIVVSKIDLIEPDQLTKLKEDLTYYESIGLDVYYVNSKQKIGFDVLEHVFEHKISVLAGQTGVGKSTLLNGLLPHLGLKTQEISKALGRGKHTTRHTELYLFNKGYIVDTPGFSKIEFSIFHPEDLKPHYADFMKHSELCKFGSNCMHDKEPGCEIKTLVKNHLIPKERYDNYLQFLEEVKNQKERY